MKTDVKLTDWGILHGTNGKGKWMRLEISQNFSRHFSYFIDFNNYDYFFAAMTRYNAFSICLTVRDTPFPAPE